MSLGERIMMHKKHQDLAPIPHTPHRHLTKMASPHQVSLAVKGWTRAWMGRKLKPLPIVLAAAVDEAKWWKEEERRMRTGTPSSVGAGSKA